MKPTVAIIGRPNVGKSTLFNRMVGKREAITLDEPGVTRDRHYGDVSWDNHDFICIDTGGLPFTTDTQLNRRVRKQIDSAILEADVVLLVVDGQAGLMPEEEEMFRQLKKAGKRFLTVVNKVDEASHEDSLNEFYPLGDELFPVSAEHGYKISDLLDRIIVDFSVTVEEVAFAGIRVAIVGRPNVGKSSLLNQLLGEERVVVDATPGTTRDVIDTEVVRGSKRYRLLDTAGIRRKGKWEFRVERYSVLAALKAIERADVCLLLLDAEEGIHKQDAHIAGYIRDAGKGAILVWNKWDLIKKNRSTIDSYTEKVERTLKFLSFAPTLFLSAKTGEGCTEVWAAIDRLYHQCGIRVKTSALNELLEKLLAEHNPPVHAGKPVKFFYATQTKSYPPSFLVFVTNPEGVHFSFERYMVNGFREAFALGGAPIFLSFRRKRK